MAYLIKEDFILTNGFVRETDGSLILAENVVIRSNETKPLLLDEVEITKLIGQANANGKVELLTTDVITNITTNYDAFIKANSNISHVNGDVIEIKYTGTDVKYLNPPVVGTYTLFGNSYILVSENATIRDELERIENELQAGLLLKANDVEVLKKEVGRIDSTSNIYSIVEIDASQAAQDALIQTLTQNLATEKARIDTLEPRVASTEAKDVQQDARLEAIEADLTLVEQEALLDQNPLPFPTNGIIDLSSLIDTNGDPITLVAGAEIVVSLRKSSNLTGNSGSIIVDNSTGHNFVIPTGNSSDSIKVLLESTNSTAIGTIENGNDPITDFEIWRVVKKIKAATSAGIATKAELAAVENKADTNAAQIAANVLAIAANTTALANKQDKVISSFIGQATSVEGALNELAGLISTNSGAIDDTQRRAFVQADGSIVGLSDIAESNNPGTDPDKIGATKGYVDSKIKYYKDQKITFSTEQTGNCFADTNLFDKIPAEEIVASGTFSGKNVGDIIANAQQKLGNYRIVVSFDPAFVDIAAISSLYGIDNLTSTKRISCLALSAGKDVPSGTAEFNDTSSFGWFPNGDIKWESSIGLEKDEAWKLVKVNHNFEKYVYRAKRNISESEI